MGVVLLAPPPDNPFTGGHLYNAHVTQRQEGIALRACLAEALPRILAELPPDAIPVLDSLFLTTLAQSAIPKRSVWLVHLLPDADPNRGAAERAALEPLVARALAAGAGAIATSEFTAACVRARAAIPVRTCHPGVEVGGARPDAALPPRVLTVANFEPRKGLVELAGCLANVADLSWSWDVVGDPAASREVDAGLRAALARGGIASRTTLHGALAPAAVDDLRRRASLFALLSRDEPYGMVFAEAIAAGVPVLAWRSGGVPESVTHERTGMLVPVGNHETLQRALRTLLADAAMRATFAQNARMQVFPTWAQCAERFAACARALVRREEQPS